MDGDRAIAKILKAEGVEWMAAFPAQTLIDAAAMEGIRPIITRQERAGVNMADGYSRVMNGRKIGVFSMQRGPGAENAFGGVAQGFADNVPFLVLPGGHDRVRFGVHPSFDAVSHYGGITKWSGYVSEATRIPEMFRSAFTQMKHGRPAPTLIETPSDVATGEYPGELDYRPVKVHRSSADPDVVQEIVSELLKAGAPMMYVGQGVHYAEAYEELIEFAELTHIPVMTTLAGKSAFPRKPRARAWDGSQLRHADGAPLPAEDGLRAGSRRELHEFAFQRAGAAERAVGADHQRRRGHQQGQ